MTEGRSPRPTLSEPVRDTLDDFASALDLQLRLFARGDSGELFCIYPGPDSAHLGDGARKLAVQDRQGGEGELQLANAAGEDPGPLVDLVVRALQRALEFSKEVTFFTHELSERYEEINLLYSISETLGSVLNLEDAAHQILEELCEVLGARRGSLWVFRTDSTHLDLKASVGEDGRRGPISINDDQAVTARVFRDGRAVIAGPDQLVARSLPGITLEDTDSILSVPIRYTPPQGDARTVGVINLIGRRHGGTFTAADQKLLAAVASQVGAALENNRLIRQSLARERMAREMELAHDLQQKLLPAVDRMEGINVAGRVEPAELVGGDFYQVFRLPEGRIGVMIGDVSSHGFPAALIMALAMSAATIYATETLSPARVLREMDAALADELERTEMYLTLFYGVLDPEAWTLTYANAGHPHAFLIPSEGEPRRLLATDPPVGFAGPDAYGQRELAWSPEDDLLLLFTDGLSDLLTTEERPDGEALVVRTVASCHSAPPSEIVDRLFEMTRGANPPIPSDDRTALILAGR